jgi:signal transduction histidine kinase
VALAEAMSIVQLVAFVSLATAAGLLRRRRASSRPSTYLLVGFATIAAVVVLGQLTTAGVSSRTLTGLNVVLLATVPWWLAAFAWSFAGPLPRWLLALLPVVLMIGGWAGSVATPPAETGTSTGMVVTFVAMWTALTIVSLLRLWSAGHELASVAPRMRLMAGAMATLNLALFLTALSDDEGVLPLLVAVLPTLSAVLFLLAFAAPAPLRRLWRQRSERGLAAMQSELLSAVSPDDVVGSVVPMLAELIGGGVAYLAADGEVRARAYLTEEEAVSLAEQVDDGRRPETAARMIRLDGARLLIRSSPYAPIFGEDEDELIDGLVAQLRLALDRARLYESEAAARRAAEHAQEELEAIVYGLSHDLRNPTLAVVGFSRLLSTTDDPAAREEMLAHLEASASYIDRLVEALLEVSRVGRIHLELELVDLAVTATRVGARRLQAYPRATLQVDPDLPRVYLNPLRAEQVLDNLIGNALRHGGRDDITIRVSGWLTDDGLDLRVSDDGQGIPPEDRARIFEMFRRGPGSTDDGTGVGLALVERIVRSYGGQVTLTDEPVGATPVGATFVVTVPREVCDPHAPALDAPAPDASST